MGEMVLNGLSGGTCYTEENKKTNGVQQAGQEKSLKEYKLSVQKRIDRIMKRYPAAKTCLFLKITDECYEAMQVDPEYEDWVVNSIEQTAASIDRDKRCGNSTVSVCRFEGTKEKSNQTSYTRPRQTKQKQPSYWQKRLEKMRKEQARRRKQQEEKRLKQKEYEKKVYERKLKQKSYEKTLYERKLKKRKYEEELYERMLKKREYRNDLYERSLRERNNAHMMIAKAEEQKEYEQFMRVKSLEAQAYQRALFEIARQSEIQKRIAEAG